MNTQRREEILALIADQNGTHAMDDYRAALIDAMDWISQLEAKAAERVIADGAKGPTPDYTGEGSAWIPPKTKPHTFAQMVNEVRDLAFDFGTCEQFRDRVSELLGKYVDADGKAPGVVVPEPTGRDLQEMAAEMRIDGDLVDFLAGASKVVLWYRSKIRAIPADRVLGDGEIATRWIPVSESLPEDGESVGFVINSPWDEWNHRRAVGGRFNRKHFDKGFGGFSIPGIEWAASHWCKLPPIPDALRANQGGAAT